MTIKQPRQFTLWILFIAWVGNLLFWNQAPSLNFSLFTIIILAMGFWLLHKQGEHPHRNSLWLIPLILYFSMMVFIRREPLTVFLNVVSTLLLLGLFANTFRGGKWWKYRFADYIAGAFGVGLSAISRQLGALINYKKVEDPEAKPEAGWKQSLPVIRGILITIPVLIFFTLLLNEADPIFEQSVGQFMQWFKIENLPELIGQGIFIMIIAWLLAGVYLHSLEKSTDENIKEDGSYISPFLGFTEAAILLTSINALFIAFVVIQFQYFFGGNQNIRIDGFTYAEYARRGFGELVFVGIASLLLYMGLSALTRRKGKQQTIFAGLGTLLFSSVGVILVSSASRLVLYENTFGFTRLRTYTHIFIIWLGVLLAATIAFEWMQGQQHFALLTLSVGLGFVVTLGLLNTDAFILQRNLAHAIESDSELDVAYLASLSSDVVPQLLKEIKKADELQEPLQAALICNAQANSLYSRFAKRWQSFNLSDFRARQVWDNTQDDLPGYQYSQENWEVSFNQGQTYSCFDSRNWD